MTTALSKPVKRTGSVPVYGRTLVVTLYPGDVIGLRQSKTRKEYVLPLGHVYSLAVKHEVARARAEKRKSK